MTTEFKKGDKVEAFGWNGEVVDMFYGSLYPVRVKYEGGFEDVFTIDGRFFDLHKLPSLKLIERKKEKKKVEHWMVIGMAAGDNQPYLSHRLFPDDNAAKAWCREDFIRLAKELPAILLEVEE